MTRQANRIIVEGMDGSGKSTLIKHLMETFPNLDLIINEKGPEQNFSKWLPAAFDREESPQVPIHDRFFYSELVYGPILRGRINMEPLLMENGLWFLRNLSLLIYARPHSDKLRQGVQSKEQMEGVHERFIQLLELYDQLMAAEKSWYGARFVQYVWHRDDELKRVEGIVRSYLAGEIR